MDDSSPKKGIREQVKEQGIAVSFKKLNGGLRGCSVRVDDGWQIWVNRDDPPERQNFTIAHELAEIRLDGEPGMSADEKHRLSDEFAQAMLLPEEEFMEAAGSCGLHELKNKFPEASYEVIARRMAAFISAVFTIFDNGALTARFGSEGLNFPRQPSAIETAVLEECMKSGGTVTREEPPLSVTGYVLPAVNDIRRVILVAEVDPFGG